jgi:hypothetical protein
MLALAATALAGCGFIASGNGSPTKPDAFLLRGYVSVGAAPTAASGSGCEAPALAPDIHAGGPVRVADAAGHTLAAGQLAGGVLGVSAGVPRCNFPFEIPGVPGGVDRYVIGVGDRPSVTFTARDLRENKPAVITIDA